MAVERKIENFTVDDVWKFVRIGNRYSIYWSSHVNQTRELLGIEITATDALKMHLRELGEEIDMGFVRRRRDDQVVVLMGVSETLSYPKLASAVEVRKRTVEIIRPDYAGEVIIAGSIV